VTWCEHCRDHFPEDHYVDGRHKVGEQYGPAGRVLVEAQENERLREQLDALRQILGMRTSR
jgi:hypothetical protein